jgi:transcription elongation factor Elf1
MSFSTRLSPDEFELKVSERIGIIPQCPFCGRWPLIITKYNPKTGVYGAQIICDATYCGASMQSNAKTRKAARSQVIENWSKRYLDCGTKREITGRNEVKQEAYSRV